MERDKEEHYLMIKGSIQGEDITIINIYAPNIGAPQHMSQMLTIVGDFNTLLIPMDISIKQRISKETQTLNGPISPN